MLFVLTTPLAVRQIVSSGAGLLPARRCSARSSSSPGSPTSCSGVFNLIPCPPLDGASVLERFIPARILPEYYRLQPLLMFLPFVLILFFHNQWAELINHVINWWSGLLV